MSFIALKTYTCSVRGMCCGAEARPIERAVSALPGVQSVTADTIMARLTVRYDSGLLTGERIAAQVRQLGFEVQPGAEQQGPQAGRQALGSVLLALAALLLALGWCGELLGWGTASAGCFVLAALLAGALPACNAWGALS